MSSEDALKLVVVELQKAAQVRSELLNTLMELELFGSQTADLKRKIADEYLKKITNSVHGNVEELQDSVVDDFNECVPTKDQELRCFSTRPRRKNGTARSKARYWRQKQES
ncbi:hypothetical protein EON65_14675 [archaeon]|nr:MAG: hypothetical protein EON65_14675 [archaeon]